MKTILLNRTIEYYWDDGIARELDSECLNLIAKALQKGHTSGTIRQQYEDGTLILCKWKNTTDDELLMFGFTQGWFK